ncbi:single-stranded DNA-binding protein [Candidatus Giovannonibacteria bacterium]|nr:single-stranded DNA-binding protein [Candidatus Giovannonibacteria bacterium]
MNLNKVFLIGNLTRDPEMRSLPSGQPVTTFGIATNRTWTSNGKKESRAEFHNIVMFGRLAEIASQYLNKGKMVFIEGRMQTRSWDGKDGTKKNRTEIVAEAMQLGPRGGDGSYRGKNEQEPEKSEKEEISTIEYPAEDINPDDIPF